jgi:hypothetical protein
MYVKETRPAIPPVTEFSGSELGLAKPYVCCWSRFHDGGIQEGDIVIRLACYGTQAELDNKTMLLNLRNSRLLTPSDDNFRYQSAELSSIILGF